MEEEVVKKAKNGDKEAFSKLIIYCKNNLYKIAKCRLDKEEDIADVIQDTIISAYNSIGKLHDLKSFKTWIMKILVNKCNDFYKNNKKISYVSIESNEMEKYLIGEEDVSANACFENLMSCLSVEERTIMMLFYGEKYTIKEISKVLNINENTVKSKMFRSKQKLKNILED